MESIAPPAHRAFNAKEAHLNMRNPAPQAFILTMELQVAQFAQLDIPAINPPSPLSHAMTLPIQWLGRQRAVHARSGLCARKA